MISVKRLNKYYGRNHVLKDISIDMYPGMSVALIGPNGSGKSTLMKCLLGQVFPKTGKIMIDGHDISADVSYRSNIGYMPQMVHFPGNIRVSQLFEMMKDIRKQESADEDLIELFRIDQFIHKRLSTLSGGMRQKVNAAMAFLFDPQILILDEPTAGLDPLSTEILKEKIRAEKYKGKLTLVSSHIISDLEEIATHILYMMDGRIHFFEPIETLINGTGTHNLSKALAKIIEQEEFDHAVN